MQFQHKKEFGQNFLTDNASLDKMVKALNSTDRDLVVEIGPGLGTLTKKITAQKVLAIEIDVRLIEKLKQDFASSNVEIVNSNILDWLPTFKPDQKFKIIGSLPYYITSPILHAVIHMTSLPEACVFLVQKEVAERIFNEAPNATYLSVFVQTFFDVEYVGTVKKELFDPVPDVNGGIIKLTKKPEIFVGEEKKKYSRFLHKGFSNPRKMLNKVFTKEEMEQHNIEPTLRPQNLEVDKWVEMFRATQQ